MNKISHATAPKTTGAVVFYREENKSVTNGHVCENNYYLCSQNGDNASHSTHGALNFKKRETKKLK